MNNEEATIAALQSRISYLEANLHLALQVLQQIEQESCNYLEDGGSYSRFDLHPQNQTLEIIPTSKIQLPTFLNSRTWKHNQVDIANARTNGDRAITPTLQGHLQVS